MVKSSLLWEAYREVSSAKKSVSFDVLVESPSRYISANRGPSTEPCGQPAFVVLSVEDEFSIVTFCVLSVR